MMTIKQINVTVGEITKGYVNDEEEGVRGYNGLLDIRPKYQREFIYSDKEQKAVIETVLKGYPLNVMYWVKRSEDAECPYEVMDGQQRTLSLCQYVAEKFSVNEKNYSNQPADIRRRILDYQLTVYVCEGEDNEYRPQRPSLRYHALGIRGDLYREGLGYGVRRVLGPHPRPHRWILGEGRLGGHRRYRLRCGSNPRGDMRLLGITRRPGGPGGLEGCRGEADVRHGGGKGRVCRFLDLGFRRGMAG